MTACYTGQMMYDVEDIGDRHMHRAGCTKVSQKTGWEHQSDPRLAFVYMMQLVQYGSL